MLLVTSNIICACQIKACNGIKNVPVIAETIDDAIIMFMLLYGQVAMQDLKTLIYFLFIAFL
jgi:hypothetical protein